MHNIAICSDYPEELTELQNMLDDYEELMRENLNVKIFRASSELIESMKTFTPELLVINADSGIKAAKTLREKHYAGEIIFTASSAQHAYEAFELEARQYFMKPINQQKFFETLTKIFIPRNFIIIKQRKIIRKILCDEILYCETKGKYQEIFTLDGKIIVRKSAREMKRLAPPPHTVILPP